MYFLSKMVIFQPAMLVYQRVPHILLGNILLSSMIPRDPLRKTNRLHQKAGRNPKGNNRLPTISLAPGRAVSFREDISFKVWESFSPPKNISWTQIGAWEWVRHPKHVFTHSNTQKNMMKFSNQSLNRLTNQQKQGDNFGETRKNRTCTKGPFESISSQCGLFSKQLSSVFVDRGKSWIFGCGF